MKQQQRPNATFLKTQLNAFFQTETFRKAVILHTIAVLSSAGSHDWWSVDLRTGNVIHRATKGVYPAYCHPDVLDLHMLTDDDLRELRLEVGLEDLDVLTRANRECPYGAGLEQLLQEAHKQLTCLAGALEKHLDMLVLAKRLMRQQL
jgi:hypothetical protein